MGKNIIRVEKNKDYTVINNTSLYDERLSWKAKAIHVFMLSKPDDWTFYNDEIMRWATDGKDSFNSGLKELKKYGYVRKERRRNENGKFDWVTVVYEVPQLDGDEPDQSDDPDEPQQDLPCMEKPSTEKPSMEKPSMENPQLLNTNKLNTEELNTEELNTDKQTDVSKLVSLPFARLVGFVNNNIRPVTPFISELLGQMLDEYKDVDLILAALQKSITKTGITNHFKYAEGILRNWKTELITSYEQLKTKEAREENAKSQRSHANGQISRNHEKNATEIPTDIDAKLRNFSSI